MIPMIIDHWRDFTRVVLLEQDHVSIQFLVNGSLVTIDRIR